MAEDFTVDGTLFLRVHVAVLAVRKSPLGRTEVKLRLAEADAVWVMVGGAAQIVAPWHFGRDRELWEQGHLS